jgi:PPM family protein phosphatase
MMLQQVIRTHVGLVRSRNEDLAATAADRGLLVLADGMGGHPAGNLAAKLAVEAAMQYLTAKQVTGRPRDRWGRLGQAVAAANEAILDAVMNGFAEPGMGTTLICAHVAPRQVRVCHIGDSRVYRLRKRRARQLTRDHTVVRELVDKGQLAPDSAQVKQYGHILTQAVGLEVSIRAERSQAALVPDDVILLCSDGLSDAIAAAEMASIVDAHRGSLEQAADGLVEAALRAGGHDNVTVVLARHVAT